MSENLLEFISPNFMNDTAALIIENEKYLPGLRELMPSAQITFLTQERLPELEELCQNLTVDLITGNLPNEPKIFDVIIAENFLTYGENFYKRLTELNRLLKDSGFLLTQFWNVRFVGILESLKRGVLSTREIKFWAKSDIVKILSDANYREILFAPGEESDLPVEEWEKFGFDNFSNDLSTKIWFIKAYRFTAEVAALKGLYTPEIRKKISRLLHRIEYGIDVEKNFAELMELRQRENIFDEYLSDFIEQVVIHQEAINILHQRLNL